MLPVRDQRGSALLLIPVITLVFVLLGAMVVDSAALLMEQRHLVTTAEAAAADAAARGVDLDALHREGDLAYDDEAIDAAIRLSVRVQEPTASVEWRRTGMTIEVWLRKPVDLVFDPHAGGRGGPRSVIARASAVLNTR